MAKQGVESESFGVKPGSYVGKILARPLLGSKSFAGLAQNFVWGVDSVGFGAKCGEKARVY